MVISFFVSGAGMTGFQIQSAVLASGTPGFEKFIPRQQTE